MSARRVHFEFCLEDKNRGVSPRDVEASDSNYLPAALRGNQHPLAADRALAGAATSSTTSSVTTARMKNVSYSYSDEDISDNRPKQPPSCVSRILSGALFLLLFGGVVAVVVIMLLPAPENDLAASTSTNANSKITCGCPETCNQLILDNIIGLRNGAQDDYTCRDRILYFIEQRDMDELLACERVSDEFPSVCGRGCRPSDCDIALEDEVDLTSTNADLHEGAVGIADISTTDVCPQVLWQDEFDQGALDTAVWSYQLGDGCDIDLCTWGNGELQSYQQDNVFLQDGALVIEARHDSSSNDTEVYTSGRIRTKGLMDFQYGYVEASIQIPRGQGLWAAFWALPTDEVYGKWPLSGEIDFMENVGNESDIVHGSIHYANNTNGHEYLGSKVQLPEGAAFAKSFHNFAVFWEKDRLQWFLDGAQYAQITPDDIESDQWPFNQRFHLLLNVAVGGGWPGYPDSSTSFPQQMKVDHVRIYDKPYGRLIGPRTVRSNAQEIVYALQDGLSDYTFEWTVPSDAIILTDDPSSSAAIEVLFGFESGYITVVATSSNCGETKTFSMPVLVDDGNR